MFRRLSYGLVVMALFAVHSVVAEDAIVRPFSGDLLNLFFENDAYDLLRDIHRSKEYEIYPVADRQVFSERVLKTNEIVFQPGGNLTFSSIDGDYLVLIANKIKFSGTSNSDVYMISRSMGFSLENGKDPNSGGNGDSPCCNGMHGGHGDTGGQGEDGKHQNVPDLYVFANEIVWEAENAVGKIRTTFVFPGLNGGNGGHGGRGGNGGKGAAGRGGRF